MAALTRELVEYLTPSNLPRQVLVKVKSHPLAGSTYDMALHAAESARKNLMNALIRERTLDNRIQFNPLGTFNHIAVVAPRYVIEKIARRQDVDEIIPDEPTDVIGESDI